MTEAAQEVVEEVVEEVQEVQEVTEESELSEHESEAQQYGWKPLDQYTNDGQDPGMYTGAKAFLKSYKDRTDKKRYKSEVAELNKNVEFLTQGFAQLTERERTKHLGELEKVKAEAKENLDMESYDRAQLQIDEAKRQEVLRPQQRGTVAGEPNVVRDFRDENPILDAKSSVFNAPVNQLVEARVNEKLNQFVVQNGVQPSEEVFRDIMKNELSRTQIDLKISSRGQRKAPAVATGQKKTTKKGGDSLSKLDTLERSLYDTLTPGAQKIFLTNVTNRG